MAADAMKVPYAAVIMSMLDVATANPKSYDGNAVMNKRENSPSLLHELPDRLEARDPANDTTTGGQHNGTTETEPFIGKANGGEYKLKCRYLPNTGSNATIITQYEQGANLTIICQSPGEKVLNNAIWNRIDRGELPDCWTADKYTKTGYTWIPSVPRC